MRLILQCGLHSSAADNVKAEIFGGVIFSVFSKIGGSVEGNFR